MIGILREVFDNGRRLSYIYYLIQVGHKDKPAIVKWSCIAVTNPRGSKVFCVNNVCLDYSAYSFYSRSKRGGRSGKVYCCGDYSKCPSTTSLSRSSFCIYSWYPSIIIGIAKITYADTSSTSHPWSHNIGKWSIGSYLIAISTNSNRTCHRISDKKRIACIEYCSTTWRS